MKQAVGLPIDRVDGRQKVTGSARYTADVAPPGLLHASVVQATIPSGRIRGIDCSRALELPGIVAVLHHDNITPLDSWPSGIFIGDERLPLSDEHIHYVGQHVAVVVAEGFEQALHAAAAVMVHYADTHKPSVMGPELPEAMLAAARPGENQSLRVARGDIDTALGEPAAIRVEGVYSSPAATHNPLEASATVAEWNDGHLTVHETTQWVQGTQRALAAVFRLDPTRVRVVCPRIGGGFGCKALVWPHTVLTVLAARICERPVKLVLTREQMFTSTGCRPATVQRIALGAQPTGKLTAIRHEAVNSTAATTEFVEQCGRSTSRILYACPNVSISHGVVVDSGPPGTWMRAPGECTGTFALESAMDELAVAVGIDPVELRLRNHADVNPDDALPWSSKHLRECYALGVERFGWSARDPRPGSMRSGTDLVGWGMATAVYPAWKMPAAASVHARSDGSALVRCATHELGTGASTVFTQVAADVLGFDMQRVEFVLGDSSFPPAPVAGGSSSTASVSQALVEAGAALRSKLCTLATATSASPLSGLRPELLEIAAGRVVARGDAGRGIEAGELLRLAGQDELGAYAQVSADAGRDPGYSFTSFGAHFCEIRVDPRLPRVRVTRFVSVMDVGRVLNHKTARSQVVGGIVMGVGMALMERLHTDASGRIVNANLADYAVPVSPDVKAIDVDFIDVPDPRFNTLGARGVGEIGITGTAAAIANAVHHATGIRYRRLPISPDGLLAPPFVEQEDSEA